MLESNIGTITPAYGRDYKSRTAFLVDWNAGKDFRLESYKTSGYCSRRDFDGKAVSLQIRFNKLYHVSVIRFNAKAEEWR